MLKPYSNDLRQKVLDFYKESGHKFKTCSIFNIGRMTLDRWIQLELIQFKNIDEVQTVQLRGSTSIIMKDLI